MRVVKYCKTPLSRQIGEAVRIRRRGGEGSILNSKAEYSRCRIPRLVVELVDEEQIQRENEGEDQRIKDALANQQQALEDDKTTLRMKEFKTVLRMKERGRTAKELPKKESKPTKRRVYSLVDDNWGEDVNSDWNINKKRRLEDVEDPNNSEIPAGGLNVGAHSTIKEKDISTRAQEQCSNKVSIGGLEDTMVSTTRPVTTSSSLPTSKTLDSTKGRAKNSTKAKVRKGNTTLLEQWLQSYTVRGGSSPTATPSLLGETQREGGEVISTKEAANSLNAASFSAGRGPAALAVTNCQVGTSPGQYDDVFVDYAVRMETQAESLTKMVDTAGVMMLKDVTANYDVMTDDNNCLDEKDRSPPVVYDQKPSVKKTFVKCDNEVSAPGRGS